MTETNADVDDMTMIESLKTAAYHLYEKGDNEQAERIYKEIIDFYKVMIMEEIQRKPLDPTVFGFVSAEELSQAANGDVHNAYPKVLAGQHRIFAEYPLLLDCMQELAFVHQNKGEFDKAIVILTERYETYKDAHGESAPSTLKAYLDLAVCHHESDDLDTAEVMYNRIKQTFESVFGLETLEVANFYAHYAGLFFDGHRYEDALPYFEKCYEIRKILTDESSPRTIHELYHIAQCYDWLNQFGEAEKLYLLCIEQQSENPGQESRLQNYYLTLATMYFSQRNYDKAEPMFQQALRLATEVFGELDPETLEILSNLAACHDSQCNYDEALREYNSCIEKKIKILGAESVSTLKTMSHRNSLLDLLVEQEEQEHGNEETNKNLEGSGAEDSVQGDRESG
jgi:tetratricopeptide (TPR) repeat protein